jgi:hypothetical protein
MFLILLDVLDQFRINVFLAYDTPARQPAESVQPIRSYDFHLLSAAVRGGTEGLESIVMTYPLIPHGSGRSKLKQLSHIIPSITKIVGSKFIPTC